MYAQVINLALLVSIGPHGDFGPISRNFLFLSDKRLTTLDLSFTLYFAVTVASTGTQQLPTKKVDEIGNVTNQFAVVVC